MAPLSVSLCISPHCLQLIRTRRQSDIEHRHRALCELVLCLFANVTLGARPVRAPRRLARPARGPQSTARRSPGASVGLLAAARSGMTGSCGAQPWTDSSFDSDAPWFRTVKAAHARLFDSTAPVDTGWLRVAVRELQDAVLVATDESHRAARPRIGRDGVFTIAEADAVRRTLRPVV